MRVLLDTHAFLWATEAPERLTAEVRGIIEDPINDIVLSVVSAWEIAIKHGRGSLDLPEPALDFVTNRVADLHLQSLPIQMNHALRAGSLPPLHRDPFDRLLIAQSQLENIPILTSDPNIARYAVSVIW